MNPPEPQADSLNLPFLEALYREYLENPANLSEEWRSYFRTFDDDAIKTRRLGPTFSPHTIFDPAGNISGNGAEDRRTFAEKQDRVSQLIRAYRVRGHMIARLDPLGFPRPTPPELELAFYGFSDADLDEKFSAESVGPAVVLSLREILQRLRHTYCRSVGIEYMHIHDIAVRRWLQSRLEGAPERFNLSRRQQIRILTRLTDAVIFEEFIRKEFIGSKSFSLEGSESLIPLLDLAIEKAAEQGIAHIVMGMAHRGRLNVLANIIGKSPRQIFREFADTDPEFFQGRGDVKYHLGYTNRWTTRSGRKVHLSLCFNPSHLEFVNPVALGRVRAKQDVAGDVERTRAMAVLIHGDASFPGEGIVQETLNFSRLAAYQVGGTLHVIVNNQIGFTTSPAESRSSVYATDVARMLQIPIFHVNGEDPEAVAQVINVAMDFRKEFASDVVIDMYGYRRLGHNETDEPAFTHPVLYRAIQQRKSVREGYLEHLLKLEGITPEEADRIGAQRREHLEKELSEARSESYLWPTEMLKGMWSRYVGGPESEVEDVDTGCELKKLRALLEAQAVLPQDFHPHPKINKLLAARAAMARGEHPLDWSTAEALALATLAAQGYPIRLSGQDTERGTFSQRHAVLHDCEDGHRYMPLAHLAPDQASVQIYNSPLSEAGVLGYEYGYSLDRPDCLTMWEAQFGDFWNVAQVIVDQFIASGEDKWRNLSGVVLLLPHGFEGQGPEHSSARLERFLMLAAEDNLQIVYPSTPAQYFHLLRRQVLRNWRKPLIVMTPKSLLRHPRVVSSLEECAAGRFQRAIPDDLPNPGRVTRLLFCAGKIFYELWERRQKLPRSDVAIVRLEQLFPFPQARLSEILSAYPADTPACWVQEEPENMGAWRFLRITQGDRLLDKFPWRRVSRPASASPATGSAASHKQEQELLLEQAFATD